MYVCLVGVYGITLTKQVDTLQPYIITRRPLCGRQDSDGPNLLSFYDSITIAWKG